MQGMTLSDQVENNKLHDSNRDEVDIDTREDDVASKSSAGGMKSYLVRY